jgi:lysyl-tRNA synthetase class 2
VIRPAELLAGVPEAAVEVGGRVVSSARGHAQIGLDGVVRDVVLEADEPPVLGAWIVVRGRWTGSSIEPVAIEVAQAPQRDVGRRDSAFVQGLTGTVATLQRRHTALRAIRAFFDERGFIEVETPTAVRSPGMELHLEALEVLGVSGPHWLRTSPEYHLKRLLGAGMSRIYELGKAYRRGERGSLHEPEFTMLEWYRAFAGSEEHRSAGRAPRHDAARNDAPALAARRNRRHAALGAAHPARGVCTLRAA